MTLLLVRAMTLLRLTRAIAWAARPWVAEHGRCPYRSATREGPDAWQISRCVLWCDHDRKHVMTPDRRRTA